MVDLDAARKMADDLVDVRPLVGAKIHRQKDIADTIRALADAWEAEHKQRLGDVESWKHWRNKYEVDTYELKQRAERAEARYNALAEAACGVPPCVSWTPMSHAPETHRAACTATGKPKSEWCYGCRVRKALSQPEEHL